MKKNTKEYKSQLMQNIYLKNAKAKILIKLLRKDLKIF